VSHLGIDSALALLSKRTSSVRLRCIRGDVHELRDAERREWVAVDRAAAFVWLAAALEQFMSELLQALLDELNTCGLRKHETRLSLFALLASPTFDSLQQVRGHDMWSNRARLLDETLHDVPAQFSLDVIPLDGKTIQPRHFELVWSLFGFAGDSYPTFRHRTVLIDLAETRNRIAHGEDDPERIGRARTGVDVARIALAVDDCAEHLCLAAEVYLERKLYLR
jgi:hypothetical protein